MSTFNSRSVIDEIIANEGRYEGDPDVAVVVEYQNVYNGGTCWGVTWMNESAERQVRYMEATEYVIAPRVLWMHPKVKAALNAATLQEVGRGHSEETR